MLFCKELFKQFSMANEEGSRDLIAYTGFEMRTRSLNVRVTNGVTNDVRLHPAGGWASDGNFARKYHRMRTVGAMDLYCAAYSMVRPCSRRRKVEKFCVRPDSTLQKVARMELLLILQRLAEFSM
jgi:hypothetical protein